MINFERKDWNQQKPQFCLGSKFSQNVEKKYIKHENKWKRKGKKVLLALEVKIPWRNLRENDKKICFESWPIEEREKEFFEKTWIVTNTWKTYVF